MIEDMEHREVAEDDLSAVRDFELTREEYDFMVNTLLKGREDLLQKFNMLFTNDGVIMIMQKGTSYEIRDIATDRMTSQSPLLKSFIAKINLD